MGDISQLITVGFRKAKKGPCSSWVHLLPESVKDRGQWSPLLPVVIGNAAWQAALHLGERTAATGNGQPGREGARKMHVMISLSSKCQSPAATSQHWRPTGTPRGGATPAGLKTWPPHALGRVKTGCGGANREYLA